MWRGTTRLLLAVGTLSAACWAQSAPAAKPSDAPCSATKPASGQDSNQSSQGNTQTKPCGASTSTAPKSVADQFPFPGEDSQPKAPAANAPAPNASHPSAASEHPFPGEPPAADSGSSSSIPDSGGSSSSSSDDDNYDPSAPLPSTLKKPQPAPKMQTPDQRVDEDLRVSKFYMDNDNLAGAYLRAKDAVKTEPDYSETHFVLAQVLTKMKKKDEAIAEYQAYLKMDPNGDRAKMVKTALADLDHSKK
ncbi:tetratricopeptide repeat protein [Edaphobacter acidisoli]|nr:tetratricopeptide repeat protein [Edaphobacter acidisoli]